TACGGSNGGERRCWTQRGDWGVPGHLLAARISRRAKAAPANDMIDPQVEARPLPQQFEFDDRADRRQIAYLLEQSPFYREKLGAAGFATARGIGGLADIAAEAAAAG